MLEVRQLCKSFDRRQVVHQLSFSASPGQVIAFLGPNGAGKSTSMKMLSGFLAADSGSISLSGLCMQRQRRLAQQQLGYLPEGAPSYGEMQVADFLRFIGRMRGLNKTQLQQRLQQVCQQLQLENVLKQRIFTLSKGFQRRVGLAQ